MALQSKSDKFPRVRKQFKKARPSSTGLNHWTGEVERYLLNVATSDNAIKLLFDHFKNLAVIAAVFGAAVWQYGRLDEVPSLISLAVELGTFTALTAIGVILFFINMIHGTKRIHQNAPQIVYKLTMFFYSTVAVTIIGALIQKTH